MTPAMIMGTPQTHMTTVKTTATADPAATSSPVASPPPCPFPWPWPVPFAMLQQQRVYVSGPGTSLNPSARRRWWLVYRLLRGSLISRRVHRTL